MLTTRAKRRPWYNKFVIAPSVAKSCGRMLIGGHREMGYCGVLYPTVYRPVLKDWMCSTSDLDCLSLKQLLNVARPFVRIPVTDRCSKAAVVHYLLNLHNPELENVLSGTVHAKKLRSSAEKQVKLQSWKRALYCERKKGAAPSALRSTDEGVDPECYLDLPTPEEKHRCYRDFYHATSSECLRMSTCAVCSRKDLDHLTGMRRVRFNEIPNPARLVPQAPHPAQKLTHGLLLEIAGLLEDDRGLVVNICHECYSDLQRVKNLPPRLSLANGLWIGELPQELCKLRFSERLLLSLVYPRVFVFKLRPKLNGQFMDDDSLQWGMRGTVSSYELDTQGVAAMVQGNFLPRHPAVLAHMIAVTFIGRGQVPKRFLRRTFGVRRGVLLDALLWLKTNNPKYFGNITISYDNLQVLPEDDVPNEILQTARQFENEDVLEKEDDGYVRRETVPGACDENSSFECNTVSAEGNDGPDVVPFDISGTADLDLSKLSDKEMSQWALRNLWKDGKEGPYEVRHGTKPVRDYGPQPESGLPPNTEDTAMLDNYWEKSFPFLFPYGRGGFESPKPNRVYLRQHIRWALEYHDKRFRRDVTFPFVGFGIVQRWETLASAKVQIHRRSYENNIDLINSVTLEKFKEAEKAEANHEDVHDPGVRFLKNQVKAAAGHIMGSDYSRLKLRSQIWSTTMYMGPPSIWLTVNPSDIHDPLAQVLIGEDINMDQFLPSMGPDSTKRAVNIASDPYGAAKFFHFLVDCILETLLGVSIAKHRLSSGLGIFGSVSAYFGVVESQGRGTLHLHMLLWLKNTPSPDQIRDMLQTEPFREKVCQYIKANFRAYLPGLESKESVNLIPHDNAITYSRPIDPDSENYEAKLQDFELRLARMEQIHVCKPKRCLNMDLNGQWKCKRRAPFPCSQDDFVTEKGVWGPKRLYGYVNGWVPGILVNARCNNDGKLLTSGDDTKNITFYVTSYAAKKQGTNFNMSAVMAKGFAYHTEHLSFRYSEELKDAQRLLLFRLLNAINREQELSAPMVISYLMGWGDTKLSHTYTPIYWTSFVHALLKKYPDLRKDSSKDDSTLGDIDKQTERTDGINNDSTDLFTLRVDSDGKFFCNNQVTDYQLRGEGLENCCVLDFFVNTYEEEIAKISADEQTGVADEVTKKQRGRPRNERICYLEGHPKANDRCRVRRSNGHRNLPNLIGSRIPRNDDSCLNEFYSASILLLFIPWREIGELKLADNTWAQSLESTLQCSSTKGRLLFMMSGLQYYHDCLSSAQEADTEDIVFDEGVQVENCNISDGRDPVPGALYVQEGDQGLTEKGLVSLQMKEITEREQNHATHAIGCAKYAKIFEFDPKPWVVQPSTTSFTIGNNFQLLQDWKQQMARDVALQNSEMDTDNGIVSHQNALDEPVGPSVGPAHVADDIASDKRPLGSTVPLVAEEALTPVHPSLLKPDQLRAYNIIIHHLNETLANRNPPCLRMILYGEGGTGKSKVIQTVTQAFMDCGAKHLLVKAAYTGVAASLIDGKTTHSLASLGIGMKDGLSQEAKKKLQAFWNNKQYLILDEYSMIGKSFLAKLSKHIAIGKVGSCTETPDSSFGGVNVILCGDLHQFPPVAQSPHEYLFRPMDMVNDSVDRKIGRGIYEEFKDVVILKEQMRVSDPVWQAFLTRLRYGRVLDEDLKMLKGLVLNDESDPTNFSEHPWSESLLVTPRHAVRLEWNRCAVRKHCMNTRQRLFICVADDRIAQRELTLAERYAVAQRKIMGKKQKKKDLPREMELAIGIKVLVTNNLETDLDITNGARGTIVDIMFHPDEHLPPEHDAIVKLKFVPICILVKLERTRASRLNGLQDGVIPIEAMTSNFEIRLRNSFGKVLRRTVQRRQFPITPAYGFTDYRAQGQTIPTAVIDIASPPSCKLSLFNLYVALSRSSGRKTLRLLRPFQDDIFIRDHDVNLLAEDDRLEMLNEETKKKVGGCSLNSTVDRMEGL